MDNNKKKEEKQSNKYEIFLYETVIPSIQEVKRKKAELQEELADYERFWTLFQANKERWNAPLQQPCNIGQDFHVQCIVSDPSRILLQLGLSFYVELTLSEVALVVPRKIALLQQKLINVEKLLTVKNEELSNVLYWIQELRKFE